jgi:hypothetical protein
MAQQMGYVSTNRTHVRAFQFDPSQIAQLVKRKRPIHRELILVNLAKFLFLGVEFVLDIAYELLQNIVQGYHSDGAAKFIDHDGKVRVFAEKEREQFF